MCLLLAFDIIRRAAANVGLALGPILMLSYKNHALDEFLADVVKFSSTLIPGQLIRTGKPELESLVKFAERTSPLEKGAEKELADCLARMKGSRVAARCWRECASYLEYKVNVLRVSVTSSCPATIFIRVGRQRMWLVAASFLPDANDYASLTLDMCLFLFDRSVLRCGG